MIEEALIQRAASITAEQLLRAISEAKDILRSERRAGASGQLRISGGVVEADPRECLIIGDVHGDFETLREIVMREKPLSTGKLTVFLGDIVDRGEEQVECFALVLLMKIENPEDVVILRGNHEPPPGLDPYPHDFPYVLRARLGVRGLKAYEEAYELFQELPYTLIVKGKAILMHGGAPVRAVNASSIEELLAAGTWPPPIDVLEEVLWNDPVEEDVIALPSPRGAGKLFGPRVTKATLELTNTEMIIRGHEPCMEGFKFNHGGGVLTLFSRKGAPYFNEKAAYAVIDFEDAMWRDKVASSIKTI